MNGTKTNHYAQLADFTTDKRVLLLSGFAIVIGAISSLVAYVLVWLINVLPTLPIMDVFPHNLPHRPGII